MRLINYITFILLFATTKLWAFPSLYTYIDEVENKKITVSCTRGVTPIADVSYMKKISDNLTCDNMAVDEYCECIAGKYPGEQDISEVKALEAEIGLLANGEDSASALHFEKLIRLQSLQVLYGDKNGISCLGETMENMKDKLSENSKKLFDTLDKELPAGEVPPYLNTHYLKPAQDLSIAISSANSTKRNAAAKKDALFMAELNMALNARRQKLNKNEKIDNDINDAALRHPVHDYRFNFVEAKTWQKEVVDSFFDGSREKQFKDSNLFQSVKNVYQEDDNYDLYTGKESVVKNLVDSSTSLDVFTSMSKDGKIDLDKISEQMNKPMGEFSVNMKRALDTLCHEAGEDLVLRSLTGDSTADKKSMSITQAKNFNYLGDKILSDLTPIDIKTKEGKDKFRRLGELQQKITTSLLDQFLYPDNRVITPEEQDKISTMIAKKKDSMGRVWCTAQDDEKNQDNLIHTATADEAHDDQDFDFEKGILEIDELRAEQLLRISDIEKLLGIEKNAFRASARYHSQTSAIEQSLNEITNELSQLDPLDPSYRIDKISLDSDFESLEAHVEIIKRKREHAIRTQMKTRDRISELQELTKNIEVEIDSSIIKTADVARAKSRRKQIALVDLSRQGVEHAQIVPMSVDLSNVAILRLSRKNHIVVEQNPSGKPKLSLVEDVPGESKHAAMNKNGEIVLTTRKETAKLASSAVTGAIDIFKESTEEGFKEGTPVEVLDGASKAIENLVDNSYTSLKVNEVSEKEMSDFKKKVKTIKEELSPRVGTMNLQALGDRKEIKSNHDLISDFVEKKNIKAKEINDKSDDLEDVGIAQTIKNKMNPQSKRDPSQQTKSQVQLPQNPNRVLGTSKSIKKITKPKKGSDSLDRLSNILKENGIKTGEARKDELIQENRVSNNKTIKEKKTVDPLLKDKKKLKDEVAALTKEVQVKKSENTKKALVKDRERVNPSEESIVAPRQAISNRAARSVANVSRSKASSKSSKPSAGFSSGGPSGGSGGGGGSAASTSSIIEKEVAGGVVVNGEFIPNILLYRGDRKASFKDGGDSFESSENSTFDVDTETQTSSSLIPTVAARDFEILSQNEKELFVQEQFVKFNTNEVFVKLKSGKKVLVKSKILMSSRIKVSDLNNLLDDQANLKK